MVINGVYTATVTPLKDDLSVNTDMLVEHCQNLLASGSTGIALLGTTGEANSFSVEERMQLIDAIAEGPLPNQKIMVGTGCCALPDTIRLTKTVVDHGFGGILLLPPFYYKQVTDSGLFDYFDQVIQSVAADMSIFLYHFPKMTGVDLSMPLLEKLLTAYPNTIVGMKDSSGDWTHMRDIIKAFPDFKLFAGTEKYLLSTVKNGGAGCISATTNITIKMAAKVWLGWLSDEADVLQRELTRARSLFEGLPFVAAIKQVLASRGDLSWKYLRPPNSSISKEELDTLLENLKEFPI